MFRYISSGVSCAHTHTHTVLLDADSLPLCCRILAVCHGVMYKQLAAWMLHGLLLDQSDEFFIRQGPSVGAGAASQEDEEEDLGLSGLSGKQLRELQDLVGAAATQTLTLRIRIRSLD